MVSGGDSGEKASLAESGSAKLADTDSSLTGPVDSLTALLDAGNLLSRDRRGFIDTCGNRLRLPLSSMVSSSFPFLIHMSRNEIAPSQNQAAAQSKSVVVVPENSVVTDLDKYFNY